MIMQLSQICKSYGADEILNNITLDIKRDDRLAIIGRNGCGKSTLLKIIAGEQNYDSGDIFKPRDITTGYLPQHSTLDSTRTIWDEMVQVFAELLMLAEKIKQLEQQMKNSTHDPTTQNTLLEQYDSHVQTFEKQGGYTYETTIQTILSGLNFPESMYNTPIHTLSGGQKTRLALGKLLLQSPDLLILDEPTNHLDIETMAWLEGYLQRYDGAVVLVSHDRYFLDRTVHTMYEIAHRRATKYVGTYSEFLQQKEKDYEQALDAYEQQQAEIKEMEEFIERNIARASTSRRARSRRKQLERMEKLNKPLGQATSARISFEVAKRSGYDVLKLDDVAFNYPDGELVFENINLHLRRGDRLAIVGPNGIGKSTLLKLINGHFKPTKGNITNGTNVEIAYYDQEQADLTSTKSVLNELWDDFPHVNEADIRTVLGNFLFTGDEVLHNVSTLSGGEKARLALAKLMMKKANLLILDEPTNHLDIDSKEVLESALKNFPGTIIFVSHDRYFINKIANQVVHMQKDDMTLYLGNYDYFINKKAEEDERKALEQRSTERTEEKVTSRKAEFEEAKRIQREQRRTQRKIAEIEKNIAHLEAKLEEIEEEMTSPDVFNDHEKSFAYMEKANDIREKIDELMEEWSLLHEESERISE